MKRLATSQDMKFQYSLRQSNGLPPEWQQAIAVATQDGLGPNAAAQALDRFSGRQFDASQLSDQEDDWNSWSQLIQQCEVKDVDPQDFESALRMSFESDAHVLEEDYPSRLPYED